MNISFSRVLRFLLSPKDRMARLPFLSCVVVSYISFVILIHFWSISTSLPRTLLNLAVLSLLALKFIVTARRWHDIGMPALMAAPLLTVLGLGAYNNYAVPYLHAPMLGDYGKVFLFHWQLTYLMLFGIIILIAILVSDIALLFIPGNTGNNRYGNDLRRLEHTFTDVF